MPRGFDDAAIRDQGGLVDVDEEKQRARDAWANRPSQVPGKEGDEKYKTAAEVRGVRLPCPSVPLSLSRAVTDRDGLAQIPKQLGGQAKRKHQLSSLLAAAHDNRAELEERIAQARQNRKGAGNKYGAPLSLLLLWCLRAHILTSLSPRQDSERSIRRPACNSLVLWGSGSSVERKAKGCSSSLATDQSRYRRRRSRPLPSSAPLPASSPSGSRSASRRPRTPARPRSRRHSRHPRPHAASSAAPRPPLRRPW